MYDCLQSLSTQVGIAIQQARCILMLTLANVQPLKTHCLPGRTYQGTQTDADLSNTFNQNGGALMPGP